MRTDAAYETFSDQVLQYPFPPTQAQPPVAVDAGQGHRSASGLQSVTEPSTEATRKTPNSQKTGPFNFDFDSHLTDYHIYPPNVFQEPDMEDIMAALAAPRPGDLHSQISDQAFKSFKQCVFDARSGGDVLANIIPTLLGQNVANYDTARNLIFGNIKPLTDGSLVAPKPDLYDGVNPIMLDKAIREELADVIVPSKVGGNPVVPNFFFEIAGPNSRSEVAELRARYHGAIGARAMHALQSYGKQTPVYDGKAYTFSSVYHRGFLDICAHHLTASAAPGGAPEYLVTQLRSMSLTDDREALIKGVTAFQNCRALAKRWRDEFVQAANTQRLLAEVTPAETNAAVADADSSSGYHFHDIAGSSGMTMLNGDGGRASSFNLEGIDANNWPGYDTGLMQHYSQANYLQFYHAGPPSGN